MAKANEYGLATRAIHAHGGPDPFGSPHASICNTTTFAFDSTADLEAVAAGHATGGLYTRYGLNPTVFALERTLASLEGAEAARAFASGMGAIAALFLAHGREGVVCVGDAYGGTLELAGEQLPLLGIRSQLLLGTELDRLDAALAAGAGLVFLETPTNPALEIFDITAIAERAHAHGALLAVDNTFASPVNQQPLALGADLVMHSATKYLGGHSDLSAGALMGPAELLDRVWNWRKNLGSMIAPETAALLSRSLRTLAVRVQRHNENALAVATAMGEHPGIARSLYPGLPGFPGHERAARQMRGFGGIVTIEVEGGGAAATRVADRLELFHLAPSLGGTESLVTQPCTTTHRDLSAAERARRGITDGMLRLSIGLEDAGDLIADLEQALA
jgi:cystathionine beta-lyase/cystathionine gamma-synthase